MLLARRSVPQLDRDQVAQLIGRPGVEPKGVTGHPRPVLRRGASAVLGEIITALLLYMTIDIDASAVMITRGADGLSDVPHLRVERACLARGAVVCRLPFVYGEHTHTVARPGSGRIRRAHLHRRGRCPVTTTADGSAVTPDAAERPHQQTELAVTGMTCGACTGASNGSSGGWRASRRRSTSPPSAPGSCTRRSRASRTSSGNSLRLRRFTLGS